MSSNRPKRSWWAMLAVYSFVWWALLILVAAYGAGWPEWWVIFAPACFGVAHGIWEDNR